MLRGEIYRAALDPVLGSEQGGTRPVVVVQNNVGNRYSPTVIVLAVTSRMNKARLPTHIEVPSPIAIQGGCKFQTRCPHCTESCKRQNPALKEVRPGHFVACLNDQAIGET